MKTRFYALLTLIVLLLSVSCNRHKGMFVLHGTVSDGTDSILVVGFDSRFERIDTICVHNGQFTWSFRPDTVTTLILVLPDGRSHPVFAEKDVESTISVPSDTGIFRVSGGYCNDSYQSFFMASADDSTMEQSAARIDSFITRDPFSEVTPYLIYDRMVLKYHADQKQIEQLISRMSGNMQDAPFITDLKSEFKEPVSKTTYINTLVITDSIGRKTQFADLGGQVDHLLICVWASWSGQKGLYARRELDELVKKYKDRAFTTADISIDVNKSRWIEQIRHDSVGWSSYIDTNGWESNLVKLANIQSLPVYILMTGVKRIVLVTDSFEQMDKELDSVLPQRKEIKKTEKTTKPKKLKLRLE